MEYMYLTLAKKAFFPVKYIPVCGLVILPLSLSCPDVPMSSSFYQPIFETIHFVDFYSLYLITNLAKIVYRSPRSAEGEGRLREVFLSTCRVSQTLCQELYMCSHFVITKIQKVGGGSHVLQMRKLRLIRS